MCSLFLDNGFIRVVAQLHLSYSIALSSHYPLHNVEVKPYMGLALRGGNLARRWIHTDDYRIVI
ncbi:hypothetical protein KCP73_06405 [Salmonella enterica subsp. enterica]|nr:hypothetical protein KCP73_06405 [Salmonella enterica subsp. enterica]